MDQEEIINKINECSEKLLSYRNQLDILKEKLGDTDEDPNNINNDFNDLSDKIEEAGDELMEWVNKLI